MRAQTNEMTSTNVSIIFGPSLLRPHEETMEYTLQIPKVIRIVHFMLDNYYRIFDKEGDHPPSPSPATLPSPAITTLAENINIASTTPATITTSLTAREGKTSVEEDREEENSNDNNSNTEETEITSVTKQLRVVARYNFTQRKVGELSFVKGDIITVLKTSKSGWWQVI